MICNDFIFSWAVLPATPWKTEYLFFSSSCQHLRDIFHVSCAMTLGEPRSDNSEFVMVFELYFVLNARSPPPSSFFFQSSPCPRCLIGVLRSSGTIFPFPFVFQSNKVLT
jgi:hypothetical protein